jgi:LysM repeat protein
MANVKLSRKLLNQPEFEEEDEDQDEDEASPGALKILGISVVLAFVFYMIVLNHEGSPLSPSPIVSSNSYTVQKGDTLSTIVQKQYPKDQLSLKIQKIKDLNNLHDDHLKIGQVLKLP